MPSLLLAKSDFKVARTCPTNLFHKESRYQNTKDVDPYMQLLADGGFMIGKWAQILYPAGQLVATRDPEQAAVETDRLGWQSKHLCLARCMARRREPALLRAGQVQDLIAGG